MFVVLVLNLMSKALMDIRVGRSKFLYHVTPGRTFESIILGYVVNCIFSATLKIFSGVWLIPDLSLLDFIIVSLIVTEIQVSTTGVIGFTVVHFIKRVAMVKDSESSIFGVVGVFDELDQVLFAVVGVYYYFQCFREIG